jgi:hypothetical protein
MMPTGLNMSQINLLILVLFVFAAVCYPMDMLLLGGLINAKIKLHTINIKMWWMSYWMWRKLNADMKKDFGTGMPPFRYIHIWNRN